MATRGPILQPTGMSHAHAKNGEFQFLQKEVKMAQHRAFQNGGFQQIVTPLIFRVILKTLDPLTQKHVGLNLCIEFISLLTELYFILRKKNQSKFHDSFFFSADKTPPVPCTLRQHPLPPQ